MNGSSRSARALLVIWLAACCVLSCAGGKGIPLLPGERQLEVGKHTLQVEIAANDSDRERGLMYRTKLAENAGMIFYFPSKRKLRFWMKNCYIALDIAYLDDDYVIVNTLRMEPEPDPKPDGLYKRYPSAEPVRYVLEVNAGWFAQHGIRTGDRIDLRKVLEGITPR